MKVSSQFIIIIACVLLVMTCMISNSDKEKQRQELFKVASRQFDIMVAPTIGEIENKLETSMREAAVHAYIISGHDMQRVREGVYISKEESLHWMATVWLKQLTSSFFESDRRLALMRNSTFNFVARRRQRQCGGGDGIIIMPETMLVVNLAVMERHSFFVNRISMKLDYLKEELLLHEDMLVELEYAQQRRDKKSLLVASFFFLFTAGAFFTAFVHFHR